MTGGRRVAVTGIGVLTGYGRGATALWRGLESGASAVREHRARLGHGAWVRYRMASLRDDMTALARGLPAREFVRDNRLDLDPDLIAIADCVGQALEDSGLRFDRERNDVGLVVTHESPGLARHVKGFFRWGEMGRAWLRSKARFNPPEFLYEQQSESIYRMHSFLYIHYLSAIFGMHGFTLFNNNACASGAFSLAVAADRVRMGEASAVVVAGGDLPEDGTKYRWFHDLGLYSDRGECRPFSERRDGMILGSGAAAFVLEDLDAVRASGRRVYAEWRGGGFTSDGWKVTLPDVAGDRYAEAIRRALRSAGVPPGRVDLIVPHGVGTGLYDRFEALSLSQIFGGDSGRWPTVMPLKGALGHTLGGCALVECAASLLATGAGRVPRAALCEEPDPALPLSGLRDGDLPRRWVLLKCTNGFAGQNGAFVLADPDAA